MTSPSSTMKVTSLPASGVRSIDALSAGVKWGSAGAGATIAYSFPYANASLAWWAAPDDYGSTQNETATASGLGSNQQAAVRQALQKWANVADLHFVETVETASNVGDIRFTYTRTPAISTWWGWAGYPNSFWPSGGDVWINPVRASGDWSVGTSQFSSLLHEIGHALGLKHPFEGQSVLPAAQNSEQYSLMSYTDHPHALFRDVVDHGGGSFTWTYYSVTPQTPMLYDIAAIQHLYGANTTYRTGNDTYTFAPDSPFFMTLWDAGGNDTLSVANFHQACRIDLRAGSFSDIVIQADPLPAGSSGATATYDGTDNLAIAFGVTIENAIGGSGNDTLTGNAANNHLDGRAGADRMTGGNGSDRYYVDHTGDRVSESSASVTTGGKDTVYSYLSAYTLPSNVENLRLLSSETANGTGNRLDNTLYAGAGNNLLDGSSGTDTVSYAYATGGVTVSLARDSAQATGGSRSDRLVSIENLSGSPYHDKLTGSSAANRLDGAAGNDTLSGGSGNDLLLGGLGNDSLGGGSGNDIFRFDTRPSASSNRDRISDFNVRDDTLQLENAAFTSLTRVGTLAQGSFRAGNGFTSAHDANDYLIYNRTTGALYYDADGNGTDAAAVQLATIGSGLALSHLDFVVV